MRLVGASNFTIRMPFLMEMRLAALRRRGRSPSGSSGPLTKYVLRGGASARSILDQAFIGVSDVWIIAPWMLLGVHRDRRGHSLVTLRRYLRV